MLCSDVGRSTVLVADDSYLPMHVRYAAQIAHGILMVAACCVLMPAGVVVARHRWLFADREVGGHCTEWGTPCAANGLLAAAVQQACHKECLTADSC
jgi:hypothetical protein